MTSRDETFMRRALELAARAGNRTAPNPLVGAVVVRGGRIVGEGYHKAFGGPHAEVHAIRAAGAKAKGATLYVSLEPCSPHPKKTPPCTDLIVRSGLSRVVAAIRDPNPMVCGRGLSILRRARIRVSTGVCAAEAAELNAPFIKVHERGLPYVALDRETLLTKRYPLLRAISIATPAQPAETAGDFVNFVSGIDGQQIVARHGYAPATVPIRIVRTAEEAQ